MQRAQLFVLLGLSLVGCGGSSSLFGGPAIDRVPDAHQAPDPAEVAADPCRFGDLNRCADRCAKSHEASSCNTVGVMFEFAADGADHARAATYYRASCAGNYAPGCNNLAWLYMLGRGVPKDPPLSIALFTKAYDGYRVACSDGDLEACVVAAVMIREGRVEAEEREAVALLEHACSLGDPKGCAELAR
jgi:TPR repeat protein